MSRTISCFLLMVFMSVLFGQTDHDLFTAILSQYVQEGKVNYAELKNDERLEKYLSQLSQTNPNAIEDENDKLAFWINAYNAFTLEIICDNYPLKSMMDLSFGGSAASNVQNTTAWDRKFIEINGTEMSLNHIEHEIIRKQFNDPRIHFALVCAAVSCPPLRSEAYEGSELDEQLNEQGKIFLRNENKNYFEIDNQTAHLTKLLDWYGQDFGESSAEILLYITRFLEPEIASGIKKNPDNWKIEYLEYDWSLNE